MYWTHTYCISKLTHYKLVHDPTLCIGSRLTHNLYGSNTHICTICHIHHATNDTQQPCQTHTWIQPCQLWTTLIHTQCHPTNVIPPWMTHTHVLKLPFTPLHKQSSYTPWHGGWKYHDLLYTYYTPPNPPPTPPNTTQHTPLATTHH